MTRQIILADDFTGAMDAAVPFAQAGKTVWVTTRFPDRWDDTLPQVLSIDLEARHLPPAEAEAVMERGARAARASGRIYIKIDSTLRGPVGSYLQGVLSAFPGESLLLTPAYPQAGRTVRGGVLYVNGVPVADSAFGRDPFEPVRQSRVAALARQGLAFPVYEGTKGPGGPGVWVADAETEADLDRLAKKLASATLACGSAGLAGALARLDAPSAAPQPPSGPGGGFLLVCGSLHEASRRQLSHAEKAGMPCLRVPTDALYGEEPATAALAGTALSLLRQKNALLLATPMTTEAEVARGKAAAGRMAALAAQIIDGGGVETLVIFGGDTLRALMAALGCHTLEPTAQLTPGVVLAKMADGAFPGWVITKAGGFGDDRLVTALHQWHKNENGAIKGGRSS